MTAARNSQDLVFNNIHVIQTLLLIIVISRTLKLTYEFCLEIKTCDPLNYTMDHSKFIASIFSLKIIFVLANSVDLDEMPHYAAFNLDLLCLEL